MHPVHRTRTRARQLVVKPRALRSAGRQHAQNSHPVPQIDLTNAPNSLLSLKQRSAERKTGKSGGLLARLSELALLQHARRSLVGVFGEGACERR